MYLNSKEIEAINAAIDFIQNKVDGADDLEPFEDIMDNLLSIYKKGVRDKVKRNLKTKIKLKP